MALVTDLLDRNKALRSKHEPWKNYWQQLGDILLPNQADFVTQRVQAENRVQGIYDGTPRLALRDLATTIDGLIKPKSSKWFDIEIADEYLMEQEEVRQWLEDTHERMWNAVYRKDARFIQRSGEVDASLACFGWGVLWIQENRARNGLLFRSFHINQCAIDENEEGVIDTISITEKLTARQLQAHYQRLTGAKTVDELPSHLRDVLKDEKRAADPMFETIQLLTPNTGYDAARFGIEGMPYISHYIDVKGEACLSKSGYHEFPAAVPRWETAPGEVYARSPGMMALPDAQTLQAMGKTLLVGGQRAVDPPTWVVNDSVMSPLRTFPGGVTVFDVSDLGGGSPVGTFPVSTNLPVGREMQQDYRSQVEAAFFKNVFNLPIESKQMTATEIIARKEEFIRVIGPVFGRLETDYIGHIVERVYGIMERAGALSPKPEFMINDQTGTPMEPTFKFQSPIQKARKQMDIASLSMSLTNLAPLAEVQPEIMDNFDGDAIARDAPEWGGLPHKWLRSKKAVEGMRQARTDGQAVQQELAASGPISSALKNVADAGATATEAGII